MLDKAQSALVAFTPDEIRATLLAHYKWQRAQVDDLLKTLAKDKTRALRQLDISQDRDSRRPH